MSFVIELIPADQKSQFTFPVYTRDDGSTPTLSRWVVDRERRAFLVLTRVEGGAYEGTQKAGHFALSVDGEIITFKGASSVVGEVPPVDVKWTVWDVSMLQGSRLQSDTVITLINDALDAAGLYLSRDHVRNVSVSLRAQASSSPDATSRRLTN